MTIEEIKLMLKDGILTLELNNEYQEHLYEFATFSYTNGSLFIDGEKDGSEFEERESDNTLILSMPNKKIEITSNKIIYQEDEDSKEFVYGNNDIFTKTDIIITILMSESPTTIDLNGQPTIATFDKYGLHIHNGMDYESYLQQISLANPMRIQYKDLLFQKHDEVWIAKIYNE